MKHATQGRRRGGRAIRTVNKIRHLFPLLDAHTADTHLVTNDAVVAGRRAGSYLAVCGTVVLAASLTAPEDKYCRSCTEWAKR